MVIKEKSKDRSGFTLIELIVVIAILGVLSTIGIPRLSGYIRYAERITCVSNRKLLQTYYTECLYTRDLPHSEPQFNDIMLEMFGDNDICPLKGLVSYVGGRVTCDVHLEENQSNQDDENDGGEEVPYL